MKPYDFLIVGSGLMGATFAYQARQAGRRCLVVERRDHTGGNVHCQDIAGIHVHQYGAHILHTDDREVWQFVSRFADMNRYTNSPIANYQGQLYNLPFNMNTFHQMWGVNTPEEAQQRIQQQRAAIQQRFQDEGINEPRNLEEQALMLVGTDIYERLIRDYTQKQWGRPCDQLPAFIIRRLPVRFVYDNNYFRDQYQGIPMGGFNRIIDGLLEGIEVRLGCDFATIQDTWRQLADHLIYTGPLDAYFDYRLGHLQYRTVQFQTEVLDQPNYQGNAVVNYTHRDVPWTRIIEHKHFESFGDAVYQNPQTVISREFSTEWQPGMEPYYPVNDQTNTQLLQQYQQLASQEQGVHFAGRLAEYKYYDMAPTVRKALDLWQTVAQQSL